MSKFKQVEKKVKQILNSYKYSHGWEHTERVYSMAVHIGRKEKADLDVVKLAALLHDIARSYEDKSNGKICHAQKGAQISRRILEKLKVDKEKINSVVHCIQVHRFRKSLRKDSLEAKVLFDADKLDSIGAVGIGRAFLFAGEVGAKLHNKGIDLKKTKPYTKEDTAYREYMVKLRHIKKRMLTKEGKRLAEKRHRFMRQFFNRLNREVQGKI
ncbi:MAG: HD domain-containing protein [Endomicrobiales bacterium]|nr:HD domain-containing protein [Endomicrobiales bacterium]